MDIVATSRFAIIIALLLSSTASFAQSTERSPPAQRANGNRSTITVDQEHGRDATIIVTGMRETSDYAADSSTVFGFSDVSIEEIPQSVQVLTRDLIDDTGALSIGELLQNVPGASPALARTVPFGTSATQVRGQDVAIFRDGLRDIDFSDIDQSALNNIASVDILKGPAGLVFGTGGPGGVINIVTKRPLERLSASTSLTLGERNTKIVSTDVSLPFGAGLGFRATGELERSDSFIDFSQVERENFSGVLAYDAGRLSAAIVYESFANRDDNMTRAGLPTSGTITDTDVIKIDRGLYLGEPGFDFTDSYGSMLSGYLDYTLSDALSVKGAARRTLVHFDQAEVRTLGRLDLDNLIVPRSRARQLLLREEQYNARGLVNAKFASGPVSHDLSVGYEYFDFDLFVDSRSVSNALIGPISVVDPVYGSGNFPLGASSPFTEINRSNEIFAQDIVRYGPITVTGAIRQVRTDFEDHVGLDETQNETLYQLGATYAVRDRLSVFAGYNTGFDANSGIAVERSRDGNRFRPEQYRQYEAGLKLVDLAGIDATLSYFDLTRANILVTDPADAAFLVQVGQERSRGVEGDVVWSPSPSLALRAGYLYLDSEVSEDTNPDRLGNRRPGAARHQANGFATYTFVDGSLTNLRLSAGLSYIGKAFASIDNIIERPEYTVVNFGASYAFENFRLDAFLSNAFDERYFIARNEVTVDPGEPRQFRVRGTVTF